MAKKSSREEILDAAERVIRRDGLTCATIEAVAAEAGVSKGGLFYHFPTKKKLLLEVIDRYAARYLELRDRIMEELPDTPSRFLKASLAASIRLPARNPENMSGLMSLLEDPELRERIVGLKRGLFEDLMRGCRHPEKVAMAVLASEGLWFSNLYGKKLLPNAVKEKVVAELLRYVDTIYK